ncbi:MAG: hypothetical protein ACRDJW_07910 [Thermomicrobiales bacterium]
MKDADTRRTAIRTRCGLAARMALALACIIAGLQLHGLTAVSMAAAQTGETIAIVVQPRLCPPGYTGAAFPADCTDTPDPTDVNLSIWWGKTGGEGPGRHFVETTPERGGVSALIPLPSGESTTVVVDNRFSQTENPPIGGAVCTDDAGSVREGPSFDDYGALFIEVASPAEIVCDIYLVPAATAGNGESTEGSADSGEVTEGSPGASLSAEGDAAAESAIALSELEAAAGFDQLYNQMHPEARATIPRAAVVGWFADEYAPQQPGIITEITGVRFLDWTWPVSGKTYPQTAEMSFVQPFGPAGEETLVEGTVRLVEINGDWAWFFGRDAGFVAEQIATYAPDFTPLGDGQIGDAPPWGIGTVATPDLTLDQVVAVMPHEIAGHELHDDPLHNGIPGVYPFATESMHYVYEQPSGDADMSVVVNITSLPADMTAAEALPQIEAEGFSEQAITGDPPPFAVTQSDYVADTAYLLAVEETDLFGSRLLFIWGPRDGHTIITLWAPDDVELELAVDAIDAALAANAP